jgi:hypothetical protein
MTPRDAKLAALDAINQVDFSESVITICIAYYPKFEEFPAFETLPLSADLAEEFRQLVQDVTVETHEGISNGSLVLLQYNAGSKLDGYEREYLNIRRYGHVIRYIEALKTSLPFVDNYRPKDQADRDIKFYVVVVQPKKGEPVMFFRTYSHRKDLRFTGKIRAMFTGEHFYSAQEPEFLFDRKIDCFVYENSIFIIHKENFQKIFRFFELVMQVANETMDVIRTSIPIANFDEFEAACSRDMRMVAKLRNIASRPYLNHVTMEDIKKVKRELPSLKIEIVREGREEKILFDKRNKWELLRLLDDDFLKSIMTGLNYEVNSKRDY